MSSLDRKRPSWYFEFYFEPRAATALYAIVPDSTADKFNLTPSPAPCRLAAPGKVL